MYHLSFVLWKVVAKKANFSSTENRRSNKTCLQTEFARLTLERCMLFLTIKVLRDYGWSNAWPPWLLFFLAIYSREFIFLFFFLLKLSQTSRTSHFVFRRILCTGSGLCVFTFQVGDQLFASWKIDSSNKCSLHCALLPFFRKFFWIVSFTSVQFSPLNL